MNTITLSISTPGLEHMKGKKEGEECNLGACSFTVLKNDGETLVGELTDIETDGEEYSEPEEESGEETESEDGGKKEKPVAVIALGIGKKK